MEAVPVARSRQRSFSWTKRRQEKVEKPADALPGRGGINVAMRPTLLNGLSRSGGTCAGTRTTCLEQRVSKAVALRDETMWDADH